jgi:ABC-type transport system substrate-binding protein
MQMAIDLVTIAKTYYGGYADPYPATLTSIALTGWGFPYTQWPQDLKDQYAYNPTQAKQLLAAAGYPNGFKTDIVADAAGDMDLLQIVKSYFAAVGIDMEIRVMDSASWLAFVQIGHKHDQLCQKQNGTLGLSFEPIMQLKRFTTNYPVNSTIVSDPVIDAFYNKATAVTSVDALKQIVRDANEYVARQHLAISLLTPKLFALYQPWLNGYNGQASSLSGVGGGPLFLGFYGARVWINQDLKKSMGH